MVNLFLCKKKLAGKCRQVLLVTLLVVLCTSVCTVILLMLDRGPLIKPLPIYGVNFNSLSPHMDNKVASALYNEVHIFCAVILENEDDGLQYIYKTWGKHCNKLQFLSPSTIESWDILSLKMEADFTYSPLRPALEFIARECDLSDTDWILITMNDIYVVIENLRYTLSHYTQVKPCGFAFHSIAKDGDGTTPFVLNRGALEQIIHNSLFWNDMCSPTVFDLTLSSLDLCLSAVNVTFIKIAKLLNYNKIMPQNIHNKQNPVVMPETTSKTFKQIPDYPIFFDGVNDQNMIVFEFILYHLHPYGVVDKKYQI